MTTNDADGNWDQAAYQRQCDRDDTSRRLERLISDYDYAEKSGFDRESLALIERAFDRQSARYDDQLSAEQQQ